MFVGSTFELSFIFEGESRIAFPDQTKAHCLRNKKMLDWMYKGGILKQEFEKTSRAVIFLNKKSRVLSALPCAVNHFKFKES